jgi:predicted HicB family RNase H-like nuclease
MSEATETADMRQLFLRITPEMDELVTALAKRRRVKKNQWCRDAINLAIDLENGARS